MATPLIPLLLATTAAAAPIAPAEGRVLRHALVVGVNDGGRGLEPLLYAHTDAARFSDVLTQLGGFDEDQVTLLESPDRDEIQAALRDHAARAQSAEEDLFLFYYSGHADGRGLRLGTEVMPYTDLRQEIRDIPAEVRLGVLDACRSGEITRIKGLSVSAPFATEDRLSAEGEAWLTATAADEAAQESDRLGGSFFTHYLVSGMRGAADSGGTEAGDGVVSLGEAYAYAYDRTVARTGTSDAGTQHPGYDFRLQGRGDLPLTDVRQARARITFPGEISGEITVLRMPERTPVAEVAKAPDVDVVIGLEPGRYLLRLSSPGETGEAMVGLGVGSNLRVRDFVQATAELATLKGGDEHHALPPVGSPLQTDDPAVPEAIAIAGLPAPSAAGQALPESKRSHRRRLLGEWARNTGARLRESAVEGRAVLHELGVVQALDPDGSPQRPPMPEMTTLVCDRPGASCLDQASGLLPDSGEVSLNHPDGSRAATGTVRAGVPHGAWTFYYDTGAPHSEGRYRDGEPIGTWTWWFPNRSRRERGGYEDGHKSGAWTEWYENGQKRRRTEYAAGSPLGDQVEWYPNGETKSEGELLGEKREGRWTYWYDNGRKRATGAFDDDARNGEWTTWYETGLRSSQGSYADDQKHGSWTYWWEEGELSSAGTYLNGVKEGRWREWHPDGARRSKGNYKNGERDGRWRTWTATGTRKVVTYPLPDPA